MDERGVSEMGFITWGDSWMCGVKKRQGTETDDTGNCFTHSLAGRASEVSAGT